MRRSFPILLLLLLILSACSSSEEEKISSVLQTREKAFKAKDLSLYLNCISPSYLNQEEDFERLKDRIGNYFKTFDRIEYQAWDRSIEVTGAKAKVIQQFHLKVTEEGKQSEFSGREALLFNREGREWKITGGL